eukprot:COSAG02_NODE_657_length_18797_cov_34.071238_11_plen_144_part_00
MPKTRTERIDTRAGLQGSEDIVQYQSDFRLILLLVAHLALDQHVDHVVIVVVFDIKMLTDEAGGLVIVDGIANHEHVVEVLVPVEVLLWYNSSSSSSSATSSSSGMHVFEFVYTTHNIVSLLGLLSYNSYEFSVPVPRSADSL